MYELKKIAKVFTSKFVGTGPWSYKKIIYWPAVSQRLRNTAIGRWFPTKVLRNIVRGFARNRGIYTNT